jgi:O-antigen biosynthesis protein
MSTVDVTISIVSFNSKNVIADCISSIIETTRGINIEIVVVDNCSEDGSAILIKSLFPHVRLIENRENVGFGRAHNQAFTISKGRYFLILNPDTITFSQALKGMVNFMDDHPEVGVSGPKIFWDEELNFIFPDLRLHSLSTGLFHFTSFCRYFPNSILSKNYLKSALRLWEATEPIEVEGVTGGAMLVRREAFDFFDENFFLFFEEHDILRRIKKAGWKIYYTPDSRILHYFDESCRNTSLNITRIYFQSAEYYYGKHYGKFGLYFIKALMKLGTYFEDFMKRPADPEIISSGRNSEFFITWHLLSDPAKYLIEISYSPNFVDRAGTYVKDNTFTLSRAALDRLPNRTGFLRILPVYSDGSAGKVIKVIQIKD